MKFFDTGSKYLKNEILDLTEDNFVLVTCHRRENILNEYSFKKIISLLNNIENSNVIFPMGYKTQEILNKSGLSIISADNSAKVELQETRNLYLL